MDGMGETIDIDHIIMAHNDSDVQESLENDTQWSQGMFQDYYMSRPRSQEVFVESSPKRGVWRTVHIDRSTAIHNHNENMETQEINIPHSLNDDQTSETFESR